MCSEKLRDKIKFDISSIMISRNDKSELRDKLLSTTPEERRKLGINLNTLWYIKKNLIEGKKITLYDKVMEKIV